MIPWAVSGAVACIVSKVIAEHQNQVVFVSNDFTNLSKAEKNQAIKLLTEQGIPQKAIAESFGISAPAVSQRLKRIEGESSLINKKMPIKPPVNINNILKIIDLLDTGFSPNAIASLLGESGLSVTANDISSFYKVYQAIKAQLNSD
ncbi:helix-turn-helix domain-containing protein [Nitrosomonas sp. Nm33]|uniref:helix-turn-helix domain-containing protein n=1 Tax=Nitrosomonas sp. Nm33 TaxID=133724 RepID=UPI00089BCF5A|nr:helix-turn-helix domain-containing protein [Nitrosomonas sp. Nm33]SDY52571.1 Homeodomain-like domain-containing protein [Nitrosomonas sp. Nm33]